MTTTISDIKIKRINQLLDVGTIVNTSVLPIIGIEDNVTKKISVSQLRGNYILQVATASIATQVNISGTTNVAILNLAFTPISATSKLLISCGVNGISNISSTSYGIIGFGWSGVSQETLAGNIAQTTTTVTGLSVSTSKLYNSGHNTLTGARTYTLYGRQSAASGNMYVNYTGGLTTLTIMELAI